MDARELIKRFDAGEFPSNTQFEFKMPIEDEWTLALFLRVTFGVVFPDVQVCPDHQTAWAAFKNAYFGLSPVTVIEGSRGFSGKSHLMAVLGLTEAITRKVDVNILGGSFQQSERVLDAMTKLWTYKNAPTYLLASDPGAMRTRLKTGNQIQALMASQKSVRGPHPAKLLLDEIDVMDLEILDAAMGQPMAQNGFNPHIVMGSTHQFPDGTFTEIKKRAIANGWACFKWCYRESSAQPGGWLDPQQIEQQRKFVPAYMWQTEYDLMEPSVTGRAIISDKVKAMFDPLLGFFPGEPNIPIYLEKAERGARYATGADWAKENDWTVITTIRTDTKPAKVVAWMRTNRRPWQEMTAEMDQRCVMYPGGAAHDATGLGQVINDLLVAKVEPVLMQGKNRHELLTDYIAAIEQGLIRAPMIEWVYKEHLYATVDDLFGAGHCPDSIVSGAMAWRAARKHKKLVFLSA